MLNKQILSILLFISFTHVFANINMEINSVSNKDICNFSLENSRGAEMFVGKLPPQESINFSRQLGVDKYKILCNGKYIYDKYTGKTLGFMLVDNSSDSYINFDNIVKSTGSFNFLGTCEEYGPKLLCYDY